MTFQLAQVNIGRARGEITDPVMAEFVARLPEINALAERSPGFVWRFQTEDGDATAVRPYEDARVLINLSVWNDLDACAPMSFGVLTRRSCAAGASGSSGSTGSTWRSGGYPRASPDHHRGRRAAGASGAARTERGGLSIRRAFGPDGRAIPRGQDARDDACPR